MKKSPGIEMIHQFLHVEVLNAENQKMIKGGDGEDDPPPTDDA